VGGGYRAFMGTPGAMMAYATPDKSGDVHAVVGMTSDRSLCGRRMRSFGGRAWPMARRLWPLDMRPCGDCARQVYDEP
jgi:hypothetical protein